MSIDATIGAAFERHQAGDLDAAEALYGTALTQAPDDLNGLQLLGLLMHQRGCSQEAVPLLERALAVLERRGDIAAQHAAIHNNLGNALRAVGREAEAAAHYRRGLALDPEMAELHVNLAAAQLAQGDCVGAVESYRRALRLTPGNLAALLALATILVEAGRAAEALPACQQLVAAAPQSADAHFLHGRVLQALGDDRGAIAALQLCLKRDQSHAGAAFLLGTTLMAGGMAKLAVPFLEWAAALRPEDADVHAELGNALQAAGEAERALASFRHVAALRPLKSWPATRQPAPFAILAIASPGVANTPADFLFADGRYDRHFLALVPDIAPDPNGLRPYGDVVVNLISDVDQGHAALTAAADLIDRLGKRCINHPRHIFDTDRETVARLLSGIPGCTVPRTLRFKRAVLAAPDAPSMLSAAGIRFPLLLRVAGTHGGEAFEKIDAPEAIAPFLAAHEAEAFYVSNYVDYQSADGKFRKYRFVFTDRDILPYHLAIGEGWKVHHYTTEMDRHAWMQAEEKAFLDNPAGVFSPVHYEAMAAIRHAIGLDFFGIDCALDGDGNLLVFEVNASILIHDDNADFPYKTPACRRIRDALTAMLARAAGAEASLAASAG